MRRNNIIFLIILVLFIIAAVIVFPLSTSNGGLLGNRPVKLGVDLNGGTSIVYKADLSNIPADQRASAMDADATAIRSRVDALGVAEPIIDRLGEDRIRVVLPGIKDIDKAKAAIGQTALLEFGEVATDANDPAIKWKDVLGSNWKPATADLNGKQVALTSSYFKQNTAITTDNMGRLLLTFQWNDDGSILSKEITTRLYNNNKARLGIFSGDQPLKGDNDQAIAPSVNGIITTNGEIEGLSRDEAQFLSKMLNAGRLQVPLTPGTETTVGTSLGEQFVDKTLMAAIIGLVLVMIFMIIYYRLPGVLAALALLFYAMLNLAIYKLVPVTLSLAGIGGFIVSMGMAVDANILIFERMKEELRAGRTVGAAIEAGFNRAWSAILDCNVTTFIACIVMYILGSTTVVSSSLVTGFALTLFIGVAISMFSAITVTRTLLRLFVGTSIAQKSALFTTIGGK
jgi:preprotein translocase subunit SecD